MTRESDGKRVPRRTIAATGYETHPVDELLGAAISCRARFGERGITPQLCAWGVRCPNDAVDARYHEGLREYLPACEEHA